MPLEDDFRHKEEEAVKRRPWGKNMLIVFKEQLGSQCDWSGVIWGRGGCRTRDQ